MWQALAGLPGRIKGVRTVVDAIKTKIDANLNIVVSTIPALTRSAMEGIGYTSGLSGNLAARITKTQVAQEDAIISKLSRNVQPITVGNHFHNGPTSSYITVVNVTGIGRLLYLRHDGLNGGFRLTVDGVVLFDTQSWSVTSAKQGGAFLDGDDIIYRSSLKIENYRGTSSGTPFISFMYE